MATEDDAEWLAACERMQHELHQEQTDPETWPVVARKQGPAIRSTLDQKQVLRLLEREDERITDLLITLGAALKTWWRFDDHEGSRFNGVLVQHQQAERQLVAALFGVMDGLATHGTQPTAEQLADQVQAEVRQETPAYRSPAKLRLRRLRSCVDQWLEPMPWDSEEDERQQVVMMCTELLLLCEHLGITVQQPAVADRRERDQADKMCSTLVHILDELPVDEGCHRLMRANIDRLMDRVQFWREHPGEAYEGQNVAAALWPIIMQLLLAQQTGGAL